MAKINIDDMDYLGLSHALRIPLTHILGVSALLKNQSLSAEQKEEVEVIHQAGERLLVVIEKILKSQLEKENASLMIH